MSLALIHINFMIACAATRDPQSFVGEPVWNSNAGFEVRGWLKDNGLVNDDYVATDKGLAWVEFIRATPLPIMKWVKPE